jgi:hypothetical protein
MPMGERVRQTWGGALLGKVKHLAGEERNQLRRPWNGAKTIHKAAFF